MKKACFTKAALFASVLFMSLSLALSVSGMTNGEKLTMKGGMGGTTGSPRSVPVELITAYLYRDAGTIETTFGRNIGNVTITVKNVETGVIEYSETVNSSQQRVVMIGIACLASGEYIISYVSDSVSRYAEFQVE